MFNVITIMKQKKIHYVSETITMSILKLMKIFFQTILCEPV
jgi:hypothetical protein